LEQQVASQDAETRLFKALVELAPIGIGVASLDSTIIYANPACNTNLASVLQNIA
jgi:PAS domain-containing protein